MSLVTTLSEGRVRPALGRATARAAVLSFHSLQGLLLPALLLAAWQVTVSYELVPAHLLPSPAAVVGEVVYLWNRGELVDHIAVTGWRVAVGFGTGVAAATVLGALSVNSSDHL